MLDKIPYAGKGRTSANVVGVSTWITEEQAKKMDAIVAHDKARSRSDWLRGLIVDQIEYFEPAPPERHERS